MAKKVKQPKEELELLKARQEMEKAWHTLNKAITSYNLYLENKLLLTNDAKKDLIRLLVSHPSVSLAQNQRLCELLYELRKKYNVPTHECKRLTNKNK